MARPVSGPSRSTWWIGLLDDDAFLLAASTPSHRLVRSETTGTVARAAATRCTPPSRWSRRTACGTNGASAAASATVPWTRRTWTTARTGTSTAAAATTENSGPKVWASAWARAPSRWPNSWVAPYAAPGEPSRSSLIYQCKYINIYLCWLPQNCRTVLQWHILELN